MYSDLIMSREQGQYPVSIATSLALESAWGIHPEIEVRGAPPIQAYEAVWFNVRTLFRNLLGSMPKDIAESCKSSDLAQALAMEMDYIRSIVGEGGRCCAYFYISNYKDIERKYPHATVRADKTPKQLHYTQLMTESIELLIRHAAKSEVKDMYVFDLKLTPPKREKCLIVTHYPFDLLSADKFKELHLLESHTGAIKKKEKWYTKYHNGKELQNIPFMENLMQVFGDAETFAPMNHRIRQEVLEVAEKRHWTQLTTSEKVRYGIENMANPYTREILKQL